jgi:hypothetical protein
MAWREGNFVLKSYFMSSLNMLLFPFKLIIDFLLNSNPIVIQIYPFLVNSLVLYVL